MAGVPDRLYIAKSDRELYDRLEDEWIFRGKTKREQFLMAMAYGFRNKVNQDIEQREEFFLAKDLRTEDEAILCAIAIFAGEGLEVMCNKEKVFTIAQDYAHGGVRLLADNLSAGSFGSFDKKFEKDLFYTLNSLVLLDNN